MPTQLRRRIKHVFVPVGLGTTALLLLFLLFGKEGSKPTFRPPHPDLPEAVISQRSLLEQSAPGKELTASEQTLSKSRVGFSLENVLTDLLARYRGAMVKTWGHHKLTIFECQVFFHLREGRLLAWAYPEETETVACAIAQNPTAETYDRSYAIYLLGILACKGRKNAEGALLSLASASNPPSHEALHALYTSDDSGQYRVLYLSRCSDVSLDALRMVGMWVDPRTTDLMGELIRKYPGQEFPACEIRGEAEQAMRQIEILTSPDWASQLLPILSGEKHDRFNWTEWAMRTAKMRGMPNLTDIYRKRLDRGEERIRRWERTLIEEGISTPENSYKRQFLEAYVLHEADDTSFDDVLIAYSELGGKLSDLEQRRLRFFGYACDPKQRLEELLASGK